MTWIKCTIIYVIQAYFSVLKHSGFVDRVVVRSKQLNTTKIIYGRVLKGLGR